MGSPRVLAAVLVAGLALAACSDDGPDRSGADGGATSAAPTEATVATTDEPTTTERDYSATSGPACTVGTVPPDAVPPPGCDRIYSPFLSPGQPCTEGQDPDCIDPDDDGSFTTIVGGGRCLVERDDPERCRDDDGDGALDEPPSTGDYTGPHGPGCPLSTIPPDLPDLALPPGCEGPG